MPEEGFASESPVGSVAGGRLGSNPGRLILLPGLGADERMFARLGASGLPLVTPRHLVPGKGEDLPAYARRTAASLGVGAADVVGGASFGSMVAAAIARQQEVRALLLLGGALDSRGLRPIPGGGLVRLLPLFCLRPLLRSEQALKLVFGPESPEMRRLARAMMADAPDDLLLYGGRMITGYLPPGAPSCPIYAIHGGLDPVMAPPNVAGCRIVPEAGHGLAWTHGPQVGAFLREIWAGTINPGGNGTVYESDTFV